jgi:hypothetical protein
MIIMLLLFSFFLYIYIYTASFLVNFGAACMTSVELQGDS